MPQRIATKSPAKSRQLNLLISEDTRKAWEALLAHRRRELGVLSLSQGQLFEAIVSEAVTRLGLKVK